MRFVLLLFLFCIIPLQYKSQTGYDKHAFISQEITRAVGVVNYQVTKSTFKAIVAGFLTSMVLGTTKELYDVYKPNKTGFSIKDLTADVWGSFFGSAQVCITVDIQKKKQRKMTYY